MNTKLLFSTLLVLMLALAGCGQQGAEAPETEVTAKAASGKTEEPKNEAWESMLTELRAVETDEEKVTLLRTFIENHPNDENAAYALSGVIYYFGGDHDGALSFAREILPTITDPDVRREVQLELLGLYGTLGDTVSLRTAAEELAGNEPLSFAENDKVTEAALECEAWELAAAHATASLEMANAETYRADYPERTLSDEDVTDAVKRRTAASLAGQGWALAHLGKVDEALAAFEQGSSSVTRNYVGIPNGPLYSYWGRTLAESGRNEKAMEMLAADAVLGGDVEAMDALHGAYTAAKGEAGFEDYLWTTRETMAVQIDDFTLENYQGEPMTFSQLKGQVVLLSIWFPT